MDDQMNQWLPQNTGEVTTLEQMDSLVIKLERARATYEEAKKLSAAKYHELEEVEKEVMNTLKSNGKLKYEAEGVAAVSIQSKEIYATPKTPEQKRTLFTYIKDKYGNDVLTAMLSVNHNTLNSWANKETEADPTLQIPGLDAPTSVETLYFRSKK